MGGHHSAASKSKYHARLKYVGQVSNLLDKRHVQVTYSKGDENIYKLDIDYSFFTQHPTIGDIVEFSIQNQEVVEVNIQKGISSRIQSNRPRSTNSSSSMEYSKDTYKTDYNNSPYRNLGDPHKITQNRISDSHLSTVQNTSLNSIQESHSKSKNSSQLKLGEHIFRGNTAETGLILHMPQNQQFENPKPCIRNIKEAVLSNASNESIYQESYTKSTTSTLQFMFSDPHSQNAQSQSQHLNPQKSLSISQVQSSSSIPQTTHEPDHISQGSRPQIHNQQTYSYESSEPLHQSLHTSQVQSSYPNKQPFNYQPTQPSLPISQIPNIKAYSYESSPSYSYQQSLSPSQSPHPSYQFNSTSSTTPFNYQHPSVLSLSNSTQPNAKITSKSTSSDSAIFNHLISQLPTVPQAVLNSLPEPVILSSLCQDSPGKISLFENLLEIKLSTVSLCRIPIRSLKLLYRYKASFCDRVNLLCRSYESWRRVRGDGNCYYRAVSVIYLEHLCRSSTNVNELKHFIDRIDTLRNTQDPEISQSKDIYNLREGLVYLHSIKYKYGSAVEHLQMYLDNTSFDLGIVLVLRLFAYRFLDHMRQDPEFGSFLIDGGLETLQRIRTMGQEAEGEEFQVVADALGTKIHHVSVYSSYGIDSFTPKYTEYICTEIHILYKSGHYDILYPLATNFIDNYDVEGMNFRSKNK